MSDSEMQLKPTDKRRKLTSTIWQNFTAIDREQRVASCDLCGVKMSYRSTVTNMKKHLLRRHNLNNRKDTFFRPNTFKVKKEPSERFSSPQKKKTLTELGGLDGLLLNVVSEDGEDPLLDENETPQDEEAEEAILYTTEEVHDYCVTDLEQGQSDHPGDTIQKEKRNAKTRTDVRGQSRFSVNELSEKVKKSRIMDLQLECLEIKKYTMQMEALMLEHQLNLPRSVYTETLQKSSSITRGTQTDIGGNNTKVFYVSDSEGARVNSQHFFSFQSRLDE